MVYLDLIFNLTLLVALSIVSIFIENHWPRRTARGVVLQGLLFGGAAVLGMLKPFVFSPGLIFDGRSIMISLGALFFGPWTALITVIITVTGRMLIGGVGMLAATLAILSSACIGLYSHYRFKPWTNPPTVEGLFLFGIAVHVAMLAMMLTLPDGIGIEVVKRIGLPVILLYPLATILTGKIMSDSVKSEQAARALFEKEELYRQLFESSNDSVFIHEFIDGKLGKFLEVNDVGCTRLGYSHEEMLMMTPAVIVSKEMADKLDKGVKALSETGRAVFELDIVKKSDDRVPVEISSRIFERDKKKYVLSIARDVSMRRYAEDALKRSNRYMRAISNCNQAVLKADQEMSLISDICRIICEDAGHRMVWVGYAENDEAKTVRPIVWAGFEEGFLATANPTWADNENGHGPTGTAIRTGKTSFVQDVATDPRVAPWRKKSLEHGYRSSIALPLKDRNRKIFGALVIYSSEANTFTPVEITLLEELAENMSFGITTLRARDESQKIEVALRESEEKFRMLSEQSLLAVCFIQDGLMKYANQTYCSISGYSMAEIQDWEPYEYAKVVHPDDREFVMEQIRKKQSGDPDSMTHYRFKGLTKRGETRWVEVYSKTVLFQGKNSDLVTFVDITERVHEEEARRISDLNMKTFLNATSDIAFMKDENYRYIFVNSALSDFFGKTVDEIAGKTDFDLMPLDSAKSCRESDKKALSEHKVVITEEKVGEYIFETLKFPLSIGNGCVGIGAFIRDITKRRRAEEDQKKLQTQFQQVQRMDSIGRLAGGVAHDFNNMLGVIIGHADLAIERVDAKDPVHKNLREIQKAAHHSADLTRQLLAFARKQTISPMVLDINDTVKSILKMLRRLIGEEIDLSWQPSPEQLHVKMDPSQIDQILANLCINARDAIEGVGKISIITRRIGIDEADYMNNIDAAPGEYIQIVVADNGTGMDQEIIGKIFEPFFTTKGTGKGTGLGLSIVYGIVKQNKGFINVKSEPGSGTTFEIYLPRHIPDTDNVYGEGDSSASSVLSGNETIILVEDDTSLLQMAALMLECMGYSVMTASSPLDAINIFKDHKGRIDLLITDVIMPEMNGRDLAKELSLINPSLKCLFMSGYTGNVIIHHGVLDKGLNFMQKPFTTRMLAAKVREVLDGR